MPLTHDRAGRHERSSRQEGYQEREIWGTQNGKSNREARQDERRGERSMHRNRTEPDETRRDRPRGSPRNTNDRVQQREDGRSHLRERSRDRDRERGSARPSRRSASPPSRSQPRSLSSVNKDKPNFTPSGLLAAATNTVETSNGTSVLLKYNEPPEARKPTLGWRLYVFKGSEQVELLHIHRQSAYLIGRDRTVADISVDHPSCSKQHAVIQYRYVQDKDEFGTVTATIKPFIIDLESTNGTHVNDEAIPVSRYYELKPTDVIKFGQSTREYVFLSDEAQ